MKKNTKIGGILLIFIVIFGGAIIFFPSLIESVWATVTGEQTSCTDTPFNSNCFCDETENKIQHNSEIAWFCEPKEMAINPNSQEELKNFAQTYLTQNFSECDTIQCTQGEIQAGVAQNGLWAWEQGLIEPFRRIASVECFDETNQRMWWDVDFYPDNGTIQETFCGNFEVPEQPEQFNSELKLIRTIVDSYLTLEYEFIANCSATNPQTATTNYVIPIELIEGKTGANIWSIPQQNFWDASCNITNQSNDSMTLTCNRVCSDSSAWYYNFNSQQFYVKASGSFNN